ncbi:tRNA lysidine(34) synthetase TilS [Lysobacter koreensis]|uniref:tRNA(Ile)-lysidine synthase n=1 Tax=Lysobacter koreensis TaxID=266122 RepID=A0ABW2YH87_9GAMM
MMSAKPDFLARPLAPDAGAAIVVGFSGGLDSSVLLHALATDPALRARGVRALHVDHGLHADSARWAEDCEKRCREWGVACTVVRVQVARDGGQGLEAAARRARHAAFEARLGDGEILALAHHRDDQAETFLLRALRASGPDGLAAMRPWRRFGTGWLWRPLLDLPRSRLLAYAQSHRLRWFDDPSNADTALDRNFLRQQLLPLLRERWPQADVAFARSAQLCADNAGLLARADALALAQAATVDPRVLSRAALRLQSPAQRARVLRQWVASQCLPPLPAHGVAQVEEQLLDARADAQAAFAWSGALMRSWRDMLHVDRERAPLPTDWRCEWEGDTPLRLPGGDRLALVTSRLGTTGSTATPLAADAASRFETALLVHARQGGERIILPGRSHSHALKHVLQDLGVPPWVRERLPLLSDGQGELLAAGDLLYSARFDAWLRENGVGVVWTSD